jgi:tight adherence protein B
MLIFLALILVFVAIATFAMGIIPVVVRRGELMAQKNTAKFNVKYEAVLTEDQLKKTQQLMLTVPFGLAVLAVIFASPENRPMALLFGVILGVIIPRVRLGMLISKRQTKFDDQLTDALMIMSSSFRGGLSLIQAIEAVVDEMPDPLKQEFAIVLGENKMGVSLDESFNRLYKRMPSASMQQMITAILLARETGGNLALIFARIISTKRERRKVEQNLKTLTIQGKIQAVVMTGLPVLFYFGVSATNSRFFDVLKDSPMGQKLLMICAVLWMLGALSIWKISTFKDV